MYSVLYADHTIGEALKKLSELLNRHPSILSLIEHVFNKMNVQQRGARGLSLESIFRCLLFKQMLGVSYHKLAFHLADSQTYRTFARLRPSCSPSKSALQGTIRKITPETLRQINQQLILHCAVEGQLSPDSMRIDNTVVESHILDPQESQLLADGVRVLSRLMAQSRQVAGVKLRFTDQRTKSKSLAFRIFHAKKPEKQALYPKLLACVATTLKQVDRGIEKIRAECGERCADLWLKEIAHVRKLTLRVVDQTQRRVFDDESVPASEKMVSLFEPHTDIIVKGQRDVQYDHKINPATQGQGFINYLHVERGRCVGYASQRNVSDGREKGVDRVVFNKRCGLGYHVMGVKKKTFDRLRGIRAGVEGNISELKRAYGMSKATWNNHGGFIAHVWSCALSYNVVRMMQFGFG